MSTWIHAGIQSEIISKKFESGSGLMTFLLQALRQASPAHPRLILKSISVSQQIGVFPNWLDSMIIPDRADRTVCSLEVLTGDSVGTLLHASLSNCTHLILKMLSEELMKMPVSVSMSISFATLNRADNKHASPPLKLLPLISRLPYGCNLWLHLVWRLWPSASNYNL